MASGKTLYPPHSGGVGTEVPSGHFKAADFQRSSNTSRDSRKSDFLLAQGRCSKYFSDSSRVTCSAIPFIEIWRSMAYQGKRSETCGCEWIARPFLDM